MYLQDAEGRWRAPNWGPMFAFGNLLLSVADAGDGEFWLGSERGLWRTRQERPPVQIPLSDMHLVCPLSRPCGVIRVEDCGYRFMVVV